MYKTFHTYFTDINSKLYTRNIRWQGVVEYLEVAGCKFWPIVRVERGLTLGGRFWPTRDLRVIVQPDAQGLQPFILT